MPARRRCKTQQADNSIDEEVDLNLASNSETTAKGVCEVLVDA